MAISSIFIELEVADKHMNRVLDNFDWAGNGRAKAIPVVDPLI